MLFNSYQFIALFFPVTALGYYLLADYPQGRRVCLLLASLIFYGYWDVSFLLLLAGSILGNWLLAQLFEGRRTGVLIFLGVTFNLVLIGIFKYLDFLGSTLYGLSGATYTAYELVLPLGISFFTFQQISYLVDRARGEAPVYPLLDYALYVAFFPQLIAGPIVRHNEIISQFKKSVHRPDIFHHIAAGLMFFTIGLAKKTLIADELAQTATPLFDSAAAGNLLPMGQAWLAATSYTLQLYFDFSGYSDMAIGLALMFGLTLPFNFNAPYRAVDIQDFWRRWHMTLSRFLRDYLYIPLGGSRHGNFRLVVALLLTMLLGGLWHGAGWTFVIWGGLHGIALIVHRAWRWLGGRLARPLGWALMVFFLLFSWVMFRADSAVTAWSIWLSMLGGNGLNAITEAQANVFLLLSAAGLAVLGPTSQDVIQKYLVPRNVIAVASALVLFYLTLRVASDGYTEFIYFQF